PQTQAREQGHVESLFTPAARVRAVRTHEGRGESRMILVHEGGLAVERIDLVIGARGQNAKHQQERQDQSAHGGHTARVAKAGRYNHDDGPSFLRRRPGLYTQWGIVASTPWGIREGEMAQAGPEKQKLLNRVRRLRGQIDALERALDAEESCIAVMQL